MLRKTFTLLALGLVSMASGEAFASTTALGQVIVGGPGGGGTQNLGFQFTVNSTQIVSQLGIFQGPTNAPTVSTIGDTIYLAQVSGTGAPTVLASVVNTSISGNGGFQYNQLASNVTLTTGVTYEIYATFAASATNQYDSGSYVPTSDINLASSTLYGSASTAPPTAGGIGTLLTTNFIYSAPSAVVPEPASLAMLGLGLVGVAAARRKMVRKSA